MLVGERQRLDLEPVGIAQQVVEGEAEGMRGELRREAGAQTPEGMGMVASEAELRGQLVIDGLDDLAGGVAAARPQRGAAAADGGAAP